MLFGMTRPHRVRRTYDHRLRDAIAATGNASLFRNLPTPASTQRTWARGEVRPVVAAVDVELEVYELLEKVDRLRQRAKQQAAVINLLMRLLKLRGGKLDGDRVPDGAAKLVILGAIDSGPSCSPWAQSSESWSVVGGYHAWRRKEEGCGLDAIPVGEPPSR